MVPWLKDLREQSLLVHIHILHVAHGINEVIRRVHGDGHYTPIVVDKEAEGVPLAQVTPSFKGIACHFQVNLYGGTKPKIFSGA